MYKLQGSRLSCGQGWMAALAWARGVALGAQLPERDLHHPHPTPGPALVVQKPSLGPQS